MHPHGVHMVMVEGLLPPTRHTVVSMLTADNKLASWRLVRPRQAVKIYGSVRGVKHGWVAPISPV